MATRPPGGGTGRGSGGRGGTRSGGKPPGGKRTGGKSGGKGGKKGGGGPGGKGGKKAGVRPGEKAGSRAGGKPGERRGQRSGGKRTGGKPGGRSAKSRGAPARGSARPRPERPRGPRPLVAVFAKAPEPGRVKTRLSPALRPDEAADLYRALLLDTIDGVEAADARVFVAFAPPTARRPLERLLGARRRLLPQPPGDLGARLEGVLDRVQAEGGTRAIVVGSDCPGLTPARVREAWEALETTPLVLGPALDGGFYLLGLSRPQPGLLRDIPWSTGGVLEATRARASALGLGVRELAPERDLDTPLDLFEWYASARASGLESGYPRTWKILHALMTPRRFAELETRLLESRGLT